MNERTKPRGLRRSVGAVAAGFVATALLSLGADVVMHATRVFPPWGHPMSDGLYVWATPYRVALTVLGGFITGWLAPRKPMTVDHAFAESVTRSSQRAAGAASQRRGCGIPRQFGEILHRLQPRRSHRSRATP